MVTFSGEVRSNTLNIVRGGLAEDTGNLKYNGTYEVGGESGFSIKVGGVGANYFQYLEEEPNSVHYGTLEHEIFDEVVAYLTVAFNGGDMTPFNLGGLSKTLTQGLANDTIARQNRLSRSLGEFGITASDYLSR